MEVGVAYNIALYKMPKSLGDKFLTKLQQKVTEVTESPWTSAMCSGSLVPRLPQNANMYCRESLVSFLRKHDVIEIGLRQRLAHFSRSTLSVYDIQFPTTRYIS